MKIACNIINFFLSNVVSRTGLHNLSGLEQFDKFVSLAHFPVSKKRTTAHLRTPFHYFQPTSRALTVPLLLPDLEKFPVAVWSPYYSFVVEAHHFALIVHPVCYRDQWARCFCSFLVVLACENDTSNFSLFSSLSPCNAIFRFHAVCCIVEIENCIFLDSVQKRQEANNNFEFTKYVVEEIILLFSIFLKKST